MNLHFTEVINRFICGPRDVGWASSCSCLVRQRSRFLCYVGKNPEFSEQFLSLKWSRPKRYDTGKHSPTAHSALFPNEFPAFVGQTEKSCKRVEGVWSSRNCFGFRIWKTEILLSHTKLVQWDLPISWYLPILTSFRFLFSKEILIVSLPKKLERRKREF